MFSKTRNNLAILLCRLCDKCIKSMTVQDDNLLYVMWEHWKAAFLKPCVWQYNFTIQHLHLKTNPVMGLDLGCLSVYLYSSISRCWHNVLVIKVHYIDSSSVSDQNSSQVYVSRGLHIPHSYGAILQICQIVNILIFRSNWALLYQTDCFLVFHAVTMESGWQDLLVW